MRYEILGNLQIADGNRVSTLTARKIEPLLATLLIRSGQVVSASRLITEIWGEEPPRRAIATLHVHISQLRKYLGGLTGRQDSPIVTCSPGYVFRLGSDTLDVHEFQQAVNQGRAHSRARRFTEASSAFSTALGLWRGQVLGDLRGGPTIESFTAWAEETRLECTELLCEADLARGDHRELVARLYQITLEHPLHEGFQRLLMLALYRSGRASEALKVYESARVRLDAELGMAPGRALRRLHQAILLSDPTLDFASAA